MILIILITEALFVLSILASFVDSISHNPIYNAVIALLTSILFIASMAIYIEEPV